MLHGVINVIYNVLSATRCWRKGSMDLKTVKKNLKCLYLMNLFLYYLDHHCHVMQISPNKMKLIKTTPSPLP